jgi:predicted TIM-barrel fold metal-dependent hydrolase
LIRSLAATLLIALATSPAFAQSARVAPPKIDHHQHLMSQKAADLVNSAMKLQEKPVSGADLVKLLDEANIDRAVVLSNGYYFDSPPAQALPGYPALVRAENDWTASEAERSGGRLIPFCSFNPLLETGLEELERCAASKRFEGIKLHFNLSGVDLQKPEHLRQVRKVFRAANRHRLPIMVHAAVPPPRKYGTAGAALIVDQLVAAAPDIPIVIAHLWGGGHYSDEALQGFIARLKSRPKLTRKLYFDVAQAQMTAAKNPPQLKLIARRMRQIGLDRILYGSDGPQFGGQTPAVARSEFVRLVPLTASEHRRIAANVAPFLRNRVSRVPSSR